MVTAAPMKPPVTNTEQMRVPQVHIWRVGLGRDPHESTLQSVPLATEP